MIALRGKGVSLLWFGIVIRCVPSDIPMCLPFATILNQTLRNVLTARSAETSVKIILYGYIYFIDGGVFPLLSYHVEICLDSIFNVFDGVFYGISLVVTAREYRTMYVVSMFNFY